MSGMKMRGLEESLVSIHSKTCALGTKFRHKRVKAKFLYSCTCTCEFII